VSALRRLADSELELQHRVATSAGEVERLRAAIDSARPHIDALEAASTSSMERAQALLSAESKMSELRGEQRSSRLSRSVLGVRI
jgi:hypothetical protein